MLVAAGSLLLIVFGAALLIGVIVLAVKLAWGILKFLLGLGLFVLCPVLFFILLIAGVLSASWWIWILLLILFGVAFSKS